MSSPDVEKVIMFTGSPHKLRPLKAMGIDAQALEPPKMQDELRVKDPWMIAAQKAEVALSCRAVKRELTRRTVWSAGDTIIGAQIQGDDQWTILNQAGSDYAGCVHKYISKLFQSFRDDPNWDAKDGAVVLRPMTGFNVGRGSRMVTTQDFGYFTLGTAAVNWLATEKGAYDYWQTCVGHDLAFSEQGEKILPQYKTSGGLKLQYMSHVLEHYRLGHEIAVGTIESDHNPKNARDELSWLVKGASRPQIDVAFAALARCPAETIYQDDDVIPTAFNPIILGPERNPAVFQFNFG